MGTRVHKKQMDRSHLTTRAPGRVSSDPKNMEGFLRQLATIQNNVSRASGSGCGDPNCNNCGGDGQGGRVQRIRGMQFAHAELKKGKCSNKLKPLSRWQTLQDAEQHLRLTDNEDGANDLQAALTACQTIVLAKTQDELDDALVDGYSNDHLLKQGDSNRWKRSSAKVLKRIAEERYLELAMERVTKKRKERKEANAEQKESPHETSRVVVEIVDDPEKPLETSEP